MQLKRTPILTGLVSASVLTDAQASPEGKIAQGLRLCNALEIRYDLFPDQSEWPLIASQVHQLNPAAFLLGTIRLRRDGGNFEDGLEGMRLPLWGAILESEVVPHWLDLEQDSLAQYEALSAFALPRGTKILLSQHNFATIPTIAELSGFANDCKRVGAHGFKVAAMSHTEGDCEELYRFTREHAAEFEWFAAFGMGNTGRASRLWSLTCGANVTYGAIGDSLVAGQIAVTWMQKLMARLPGIPNEASLIELLKRPALFA
jgi:3-dehydroquinate dehydratase-1